MKGCLYEVLFAGAEMPEHNPQVGQVQREGVVVGLHHLYRGHERHLITKNGKKINDTY